MVIKRICNKILHNIVVLYAYEQNIISIYSTFFDSPVRLYFLYNKYVQVKQNGINYNISKNL